jgi:hypothetical protein
VDELRMRRSAAVGGSLAGPAKDETVCRYVQAAGSVSIGGRLVHPVAQSAHSVQTRLPSVDLTFACIDPPPAEIAAACTLIRYFV